MSDEDTIEYEPAEGADGGYDDYDGPDLSGARGMRTDYCGELTVDDADREVTLCGWVDNRREHGEKLAFIDLRDHTGIIQVLSLIHI